MSFIAEALTAVSTVHQDSFWQLIVGFMTLILLFLVKVIAGFVPLVLIFLVVYFFICRSRRKKIEAHKQLIDSIKEGNEVVISNVISGTINKISDLYLFVEIASGLEVKVLKSSVTNIIK